MRDSSPAIVRAVNAFGELIGSRREGLLAVETSSDSQPFHDTTIFQVLLDNLVDILLIHIRIPDVFGINHDYRSFVTAIKTASIVDAYSLAFAIEFQRLDALLGIVAHGLCAKVVAT
jgi:hypothetical protein